jgi:hypothetical protein
MVAVSHGLVLRVCYVYQCVGICYCVFGVVNSVPFTLMNMNKDVYIKTSNQIYSFILLKCVHSRP